jgi:hypothetical protein
MAFTEMTLTELVALGIFALVAVYAVIDGVWPALGASRPRWLFRY